jgi:hypothetical protein
MTTRPRRTTTLVGPNRLVLGAATGGLVALASAGTALLVLTGTSSVAPIAAPAPPLPSTAPPSHAPGVVVLPPDEAGRLAGTTTHQARRGSSRPAVASVRLPARLPTLSVRPIALPFTTVPVPPVAAPVPAPPVPPVAPPLPALVRRPAPTDDATDDENENENETVAATKAEKGHGKHPKGHARHASEDTGTHAGERAGTHAGEHAGAHSDTHASKHAGVHTKRHHDRRGSSHRHGG